VGPLSDADRGPRGRRALAVAVSEENVEAVRRGFEAFNAFMRDDMSSEGYAEGFDPQVEVHWRDQRTYPDTPQHVRGIPEVVRFARQFRGTWADLVEEPLEWVEADDDRVLTLVRLSGRGRESEVPLVIHFWQLSTIRDGRFREIEYFRHRADARRAAGLRE
jgi:SnoaL-like domain